MCVFFFKQKTAYEIRISDWSSDVCSSDLFPNTPPEKRSADWKEALNPDNLMCRATKAIKDAVPDIGILTDVALDPYTSHGQDGLIDAEGYVLNDARSEARRVGIEWFSTCRSRWSRLL